MSDAIAIPFSKLIPWDGNVRKTGAASGIDELAASIAAHGLLQSLVVRKTKGGKYHVIAGRRRYLALKSLVESGAMRKDQGIPCTVTTPDASATELSLAENIIRAPMHPADQFEAFRDIVDEGASVADVAARFGVPEGLVVRRLKLGRLSPVILDAYRSDELTLEEAEAFTLTDDRETQERIFSDLPDWQRNASIIRRMLTQGEVPASDKRVRFVGLDVYEAAGGAIRRDLFVGEGGGYVQDVELLDRLVAEKLAAAKAEIAHEGWAWIEAVADIEYGTLSRFGRVYPESEFATEEERLEHERLSAEYDALVDDDDADTDRLDAIEQRLSELQTVDRWPAESLATAGAILHLGYDGELVVERGLVRPEDRKALKATRETASHPAALPASLVTDLTAQKSAAIGAELLARPDIALAAVVHALLLQALYLHADASSCLQMSLRVPNLSRMVAEPDRSSALARLEQERSAVFAQLPDDQGALWDWCLARTQDELLRLLAFVAAISVDAVQGKSEHPDSGRLAHGAQLAAALSLDMRAWFVPGAENYFGRLNRPGILAAIDEANGTHAPSLEKLKKSELAVRAEALIANTDWLPPVLRGSDKTAA
jgi:ParB family chromosome partitioning protein